MRAPIAPHETSASVCAYDQETVDDTRHDRGQPSSTDSTSTIRSNRDIAAESNPRRGAATDAELKAAQLQGQDVDNDPLLAAFERLSNRVRHPALELDLFLTESPRAGLDAYDDAWAEQVDLTRVPDEEIEQAQLRRGALLYAANLIIDRVLDDVARLLGANLPGDAEGTFAEDHLPPRFRRHYDAEFHRKLLATTAKVAQDFADPNGGDPACTAEELVRYAVIEEWEALLDLTDLGQPWAPLTEYLLADLDFEYLFSDDMDGIEDDPLAPKLTGIDVRGINDWFAPFNNESIVHPYAVDPRERVSRLHDWSTEEIVSPDTLPVPEPPILGMEPLDDLIAAARQQARETAPNGTWIPDPETADESIANAPRGEWVSGLLTFQAEVDGSIKTEPVLRFRPHGHHPRTGRAWAEVAYTSGRSEVPLAVVVAFTPDPSIRENWERMFTIGDA